MTVRKRKGAIVGFGFIAEKGHLPAYQASEDLEIIAVADVSGSRRAWAAQLLPGVRIYEDVGSLLHCEQDLDFVDISTPPYAHAMVAKHALERGLHVLCEKPLATSIADAQGLLAQAEKQRRVLFPSHNYQHAPVIKAVRAILEAGTIGSVHSVTLNTFRNTHAKGVRDWNTNWRREKRYSGGGIAMDHGSHTFYLAFEWLRGYPTAVTAKMSTLGSFDTEDNYVCTLDFPTGIATAHLTWTAGNRKVIYTLHGDNGAIRVEDDELEISVMQGTPSDNPNQPTKWNIEKQSVSSKWMDASHSAWFSSLFEEFSEAIDQRDFVGKQAQDALHCMDVICTSYASANDGCRELPLHSFLS
jgi:predicted dehydrogenase